MDIKALLTNSHQILSEAGIDHALIGGLALGALGIQRFTNDVDFLVSGEDRLKIKIAFSQFGYRVFFESEEVMQLEGQGSVDFLLASRNLTKVMLRNAKPLKELEIKCLTAEDLIGLKIQAYKNNAKREFQDKADIQSLIQVSKKLNWDQVKKYADIFTEWLVIKAMKESLNESKKK